MATVIDAGIPYLHGRGSKFCRGCGGRDLSSILNLGKMPLSNKLPKRQFDSNSEFPLELKICKDCSLGQVADEVKPEEIFNDYRYMSSISSTFMQHAEEFSHRVVDELELGNNDWVLEIASNDGYMLRNFVARGIKSLGIEPAKNISDISKSQGIPTICKFFSLELAKEIRELYGPPKLIIANNVLAHVPDLINFFKGLEYISGSYTKISIENPSLLNLLTKFQFDTIYHEHYSYLSASSMANLSEIFGLKLIKIEKVLTHGGSNRYWLTKNTNNIKADISVPRLLAEEESNGMLDEFFWHNFSTTVQDTLNKFKIWLEQMHLQGIKVYGYGAAAKASTLLNYMKLEPNLIQAIADSSPEKQHRFMPRYGIPIISPDKLKQENPTHVIIFPWNIKSEIVNFLNTILTNDVNYWCVIPNLHQVK